MKVAKLVEFSLLVRVIVDENATDDQIIAASYEKVQDKVDNRELGDNCVEIEDDEECPYDHEGLDKNLSAIEAELIKKLCTIKGDKNNTIDLNAYARGLSDMFRELKK